MKQVWTPVNQLLQTGVQHHQAGRLTDAELIYRQILNREPNHADALHLLGVLAGQTGHLQAAVDLVGRAVAAKPDFADAYANLGRLLADQKDLEKSVAAYRRVTELRPRDAGAWYALGLARRMHGQSDQATVALETAIRLNPRYAEAHCELGKIFRSHKQLDQAIEKYRRAIAIKPDYADAHHNLANVLMEKALPDEASAEYHRAIELNPNIALFHAGLGDAFVKRDRFNDAIKAYNAALALEPDCVQARSGAATALTGLHRFEEAIAIHQRALELEPKNAKAHQSLAETLFAARDIVGAEQAYRRALELNAGDGASWVGLGITLNAAGRFLESTECFRKALAIDPNDATTYKHLAVTSDATSVQEIDRLLGLVQQPGLPEAERAAAGFALGKLLDDANQFDEAFASYAAANALVKQMRSREGSQFDAAELNKRVDRMLQTFTREFFEQRSDWGNPSELPVFIVGMPRSGTTLVEQIAASHSRLFGAGELPDIVDFAASLLASGDATTWRRDAIANIAQKHLDKLRALGKQAVCVIDKMPANVFNLGLIATLFPNARVIFCRRDPLDNCLSCFFQWFAKGSQMFSYDLGDCATQYLQQKRLTEHWHRVLPLRAMTMQYEELVADLEGQSRRLIEFLGLDWEAGCLDFHKTRRTVVTASVWQVRQPLYSSSVARWRHYEKHIAALSAALDK